MLRAYWKWIGSASALFLLLLAVAWVNRYAFYPTGDGVMVVDRWLNTASFCRHPLLDAVCVQYFPATQFDYQNLSK